MNIKIFITYMISYFSLLEKIGKAFYLPYVWQLARNASEEVDAESDCKIDSHNCKSCRKCNYNHTHNIFLNGSNCRIECLCHLCC